MMQVLVTLLSRLIRTIRQQEGIVLAAMLLIVLGIWGFLAIADEVMEQDAQGFDEWILVSLRRADASGNRVGPAWLANMARDVTSLGSFSVLFLMIASVAGFFLLSGQRWLTVFILVASGGGLALIEALKLGFARPRPELLNHLDVVSSYSFPSGHSMGSAVVYLTLGALVAMAVTRGRLKTYALSVAAALTVLVGLSRVFLGVHYPSDVLAGWAAGSAWALLCWLGARRMHRSSAGRPEKAQTYVA